MLVFDSTHSQYEIDPHYLNIKPLLKIWHNDTSPKKGIAKAKLMWLYHMYNPHSPFRDYRNITKSLEIVKSTFPASYLAQKEREFQELIDDANRKNKDIEDFNKKVEQGKDMKEPLEVPDLKLYDPEYDEEMQEAIRWYRDYHLKQTPLWTAYESYKEAMNNLSTIVRDPDSTANDIRIASTELDTIPLKMEKMRQQAVKDEAQQLKVAGDKNIKRSEMLPNDRKKKG